MQIYSDGKNRVIKGTFPKRFRLLNAGAEVPYLRTAKDAIRLSGELPIGLLDIEEVEQKKTAQPAKLDAASLAIINKGDFDRIDILNKKLAINQEQMNSQLSALTEHEATLTNLETQNAQAIEKVNTNMVEMAKAFGKEIQADRDSIASSAVSLSTSFQEAVNLLNAKIESHEEAKNPHNITKASIGLERVDNTSDIDKPISKSVKKALEEKADKSDIEELIEKIDATGKRQDAIENMNLLGGVGGNELPIGGKEGQFLAKGSDRTGDYKWVNPDSSIGIIRVDELPATGETNILYLVPVDDPETKNIYDEYIWAVQSDDTYGWEKLGTTEVDLSGYVPTSRTINNKALTEDITLTASDVGAVASNTAITGATKCKITYDSKGLVTAGSDLEANDIPSLTISKISDITATASELNVLDGITASTTELNYLDGVTSSIQTQLNGKQPTGNYVTTDTAQTINQSAIKTFKGRVNFVGTGDANAIYLSTDTRIDVHGTSRTVLGFANGTFLINNAAYPLNLRGSGSRPYWNGSSYLALSSDIGNATLTIQKNGTDVATFTANSSTNQTANISVPTDTSDLTNGAGFITGITSGDVTTALGYTPYDASNPNGYTSNTGTVTSVNNVSPVNGNVSLSIPTVNDSTITIQKNGTTVDSFTTNDSSAKTINITVPTSAADVSALPSSTKYGADLSYSSNTLQLKDQDGNNLGSAVTISAHNLFDLKWSDYELNDQSWLRADTFSWQDGTVYTDAYNHLVADYNDGTSTTETVGSYTITYILATDGHKITTDETAVANIYNESGVAWYYIIDTENQRFKLPRTKYGFVGLRDLVGKYIPESLPNITGYLTGAPSTTADGAFYADGTTSNKLSGGSYSCNKFHIDASRSSSVYQNNAPVQQRATQMYLYFYVGQFSQSATEQTAGLNSELFNGKVDLNAANLSTQGKSLISGLSMPSNRYIDLTLGASGSTYTAPANGWVLVGCTGTAGSTYFEIVANNISACASYNGGWGRAMAPIKKNQTFQCYYGGNGFTKQMFRFCYAEGEPNV